MRTIYKYQLQVTDRQSVRMPVNAEILSVQVQNGIPCIWALVDPANPDALRVFEIFGTGQQVYEDMGVSRNFIGTFQMHGGSLVFHLFERL